MFSESTDVLFTIFGLNVTSEVTTMWGIMAVLAIVSLIVTKNFKEKPGALQSVAELAILGLKNFFTGILGEEKTKRYFALFATLFIFIIISNFSGLLPGADSIEGFKSPTSSLSITAGLALIVFFATHILGFRANGVGYLKHFIEPLAFMLPFLIIDEIVRPMSLALRLYGNVFGDETVTEQLFDLFPVGLPIVMMVLSLLFCIIQAVVFTMLSAIYIGEATEPGIRLSNRLKK